MAKRSSLVCVTLVGLWAGNFVAAAEKGKPAIEARLAEAEKFVAASDKYLHQSKLRRGMSGYGLTVMAGTKVERFSAKVVSVLKNWYPHQDVILVELGGLNLHRSGVISGMSGSPVYVRDAADGKDKMIGAVAYGWWFQNEPIICGVQPIVQMLAVQGVPLGADSGDAKAPKPKASVRADRLDPKFAATFCQVKKADFAALAMPRRRRVAASSRRGRLLPLATPVMVSGVRAETLARAEKLFVGTSLRPMQSGAVGAVAAADRDAKLAPGMGIAVPLATGDTDWAAVGTVTDVLGKHVLAFGHSFYAAGPIALPMGPAYVHTVISCRDTSFKLGSTLRITGALTHDEYTAVAGRIGAKATMIPMTLTVRWSGKTQTFRYNIVRHKWITAALASLMVGESVYANRDLPDEHTIDYAVAIDFGGLGIYRAANRCSAAGLYDVASDVSRPIAALANATLGRPVFAEKIDMTIDIQPTQTTATVLSLKLDRHKYKPGQTVRGKATVRPFRQKRTTIDVAMDLPDDLPDGSYRLTVCDGYDHGYAMQSELPHRFDPKDVKQLFAAIQRAVTPRMDHLYVRLPLGRGGLAVRRQELDRMPGSLAGILAQAAPPDSAHAFSRTNVKAIKTPYALAGSAGAEFTVEKEPRR